MTSKTAKAITSKTAKAIGGLLAAGILLGAAATAGAGTERGAAGPVVVAPGGRVSVSAEQAPLAVVLDELAQRTGVRVDWLGARGDEPVRVRLEEVSLRTALQHLLAGRSHGIALAAGRPVRVWVGSRTPRARAVQAVPGPREELARELEDLRFLGLEDEDPVYRAEALELLGDREDAGARDVIAEALARDEDRGVREVALAALAERPGGPDPVVLATVVAKAGELGAPALSLLRERAVADAAAEAALVQIANTDRDPAVRALAARALDEVDSIRRAA